MNLTPFEYFVLALVILLPLCYLCLGIVKAGAEFYRERQRHRPLKTGRHDHKWIKLSPPYLFQCVWCPAVKYDGDRNDYFPEGLYQWTEAVRLGGTEDDIMRRFREAMKEAHLGPVEGGSYADYHA